MTYLLVFKTQRTGGNSTAHAIPFSELALAEAAYKQIVETYSTWSASICTVLKSTELTC